MARTQRLIALLPFLFLFFASAVHAEEALPITVTVWDYATPDNSFNSSPALPDTQEPVGVFTTDQVWQNFDAEPVMGLVDDFVVRYEGTLTTDVDAAVRFYVPADDGAQLFMGGTQIINDWFDKGGGGSVSDPVQFTANQPVPFTLWFYENGGAAWVQLWWDYSGEWQPVSASVFVTPTTTTTSTTTTTTLPATTTTAYVEEVLPTTSTTLMTTTTSQPQETTTTSSSVMAFETQPTHQDQNLQSVTSLPVQTFVSVPSHSTVPATSPTDAPTTTQLMPEPVQPIQELSSLPPTEEYQSAQVINGGVIGVGLKPVTLISRGLREGVTAAQQRMVVAASVLIAIPSPVGASRRKTTK